MTEHKLCTIFTVFFILISLLTTTSSMNINAQTVTTPKVGVYYYPWYSGNWSADHWNCPDTPYMGRYDSSNSSVIVQHLNWLEQLGINFIIFSWWGKYSTSDNNTKLILNQIEQNYTNLQFFIMVEPFGNITTWEEVYEPITGVYNFSMIYNYIHDTYSSKFSTNCFLLDGKPAIGFYDDPNRNLTHNGIPADNRFTTRLIGCNATDDWEFQVPNATLSTQPVCRDGEISVCPRYDKDNQHLDVNYAEGLYDTQWSKAKSEVGKGNVKIITIISWNEYAERTQIEPTFDTTSAYPENPFYLYTKTQHHINDLVSITAASTDSSPSEIPFVTIIAVLLAAIGLTVVIARRKRFSRVHAKPNKSNT